MTERTFTVIGEPRGQGRPRFVRATGRAYKASEDVAWERRILTAYIAKYHGEPPINGPFVFDMVAYLSIPESGSAAKKARLIKSRPTKKPDLDNCVKAAMDALNGVAYTDDKFCVALRAEKRYTETPRLEITIRGRDEC